MKNDNKYSLITGAGRGLGKAIAIELASRNRNLLLLAKEGEDLQGLSQWLQSRYHVKVKYVELDFLQPNVLNTIKLWIKDMNIDFLINNAGIGGTMLFEETSLNHIDAILKININMLSMMTRLLIPKLQKHTHSYILNIASMASFCPIAYKTVYPASKAFVYSLSKSLAIELKASGIHVSVMLPGPIKTNSEVCERIEKQGWWVKLGLQTPKQLASIAIKATLNHRHVIIPGIINKINWAFLKVTPDFVRIPLISKGVKNEMKLTENLA